MSRAEAVTLTKAIFVGLLLGSLLPAVLPVSPITACLIVAIILFVLIVGPRADIVYALVGVLIGAVLTFFVVKQLGFGTDVLIGLALVAAVGWM